MLVRCAQCEKDFDRTPKRAMSVKNNFCSRACQASFAKTPVPKICVICGNPFSVRPSEAKKIHTCGDRACLIANKLGPRNPNWHHGKTKTRKLEMSTVEYKAWRKAVFERDGYKCVFCGDKGELNADHILPWAYFPAERLAIGNGRTLCVACHRKTYKDVFEWRLRIEEVEEIRPGKGVPFLIQNTELADVFFHGHTYKTFDLKRHWIGVDFDGCLQERLLDKHYADDELGNPVQLMRERVLLWRKLAMDVRLFTARASDHPCQGRTQADQDRYLAIQIEILESWCLKYLGEKLPITCEKDNCAYEIWDDRSVSIERNTGKVLGRNPEW
jgi:5-methylcytosine-specific restriction endonuclease McrA